MGYLADISKIIDKHRQEAVITCEESCWCWDVEAVICGHPDESEEEISKLKEANSLRKWAGQKLSGPGSSTCDRVGILTEEDCKTCVGTGSCRYGKTEEEFQKLKGGKL